MGSSCCSCLRSTAVSPTVTPVIENKDEILLRKLMEHLSEWINVDPDDVRHHREALQVAGFFGNTPDFEAFINHLRNDYDDVQMFRDQYLSAFRHIGWLPRPHSPRKVTAYNLFITTKIKKRSKGGDE